uniref:Proteasome subunit beta n=1 Tax=Franklinothrips vespiformis TaxID=297892 RepID=A0A481SXX4_FRAVS|nr:proteasome subunit beta type protein [Franklinothrips vespiformis]
MSIMEYNGGCCVAMAGKDCVAIASDLRFGIQGITVGTDYEKVFELGPQLFVGLPGLATDAETVLQRLKFRVNMYELKEGRAMQPKVLGAMLSNMLYERRFGPFFVEPMIAGINSITLKPYMTGMDMIGCLSESEDFIVSGTCSEQLFGMCEATWEPNLEPDDLFETISQVLMNAFDRDAASGWGAVVHIIEKDKVTTKKIKTRMD